MICPTISMRCSAAAEVSVRPDKMTGTRPDAPGSVEMRFSIAVRPIPGNWSFGDRNSLMPPRSWFTLPTVPETLSNSLVAKSVSFCGMRSTSLTSLALPLRRSRCSCGYERPRARSDSVPRSRGAAALPPHGRPLRRLEAAQFRAAQGDAAGLPRVWRAGARPPPRARSLRYSCAKDFDRSVEDGIKCVRVDQPPVRVAVDLVDNVSRPEWSPLGRYLHGQPCRTSDARPDRRECRRQGSENDAPPGKSHGEPPSHRRFGHCQSWYVAGGCQPVRCPCSTRLRATARRRQRSQMLISSQPGSASNTALGQCPEH